MKYKITKIFPKITPSRDQKMKKEGQRVAHQRHHPHALHVPGGAPRIQLGGGVAAGGRGGGQGGGGGRGSDGGSVVVHASQVESLQADAGHAVLDLLRPQLRRLLLLLDQPVERGRGGRSKEDTMGGKKKFKDFAVLA